MINLPECANNTAVVNSRDKDGEEISQESGLLLKVECQSFVVTVYKIEWL